MEGTLPQKHLLEIPTVRGGNGATNSTEHQRTLGIHITFWEQFSVFFPLLEEKLTNLGFLGRKSLYFSSFDNMICTLRVFLSCTINCESVLVGAKNSN